MAHAPACTHPEHHVDDARGFVAAVERACRERGLRLTPVRAQVLGLIAKADTPLKAYDLLDQLRADASAPGAAAPPTVYRALDFLQSIGLAHKIESLNAYVACGHASHSHSAVFLICDTCGAAEELHAETTSSALRHETEAAGFALKNAVIEARGTCRRCRT